jgi:hypothetical protein
VKQTAPSAPTSFIGENTLQLLPVTNVNECVGHTVQIGDTATGASGTLSYIWNPTTGLSNAHIAKPIATTNTTRFYTETVLDAGTGCMASATITVSVGQTVSSIVTDTICGGSSFMVGTHAHNAAGTYTDTLVGFSSTGCDSIVTLHLAVHNVAHAIISQTGGTLSTGNYASYQWLYNGTPITASNASTINPSVNGSYAVIVADATGCTDTSAAYSLTTIGISETSAQAGLSIYPNPAADQVTLSIDPSRGEIISVHITDMIGQIVYSSKANNSTVHIDTHTWTPGLYVISGESSGGLFSQKMMKQ